MSDLNEFKSIADKMMDDINVTQGLKNRTLDKCKTKKTNWSKITLIPVVCACLFLVSIGVYRYHYLKTIENPMAAGKNDQNINLMMDNNKTLPAEQGNTAEESSPKESIQINSLEEARKHLDGAVLTPSYVPEGFNITEIRGVMDKDNLVTSVWTYYSTGDKFFSISIEKDGTWKEASGFDSIDIKGNKAYIKHIENTGYTELRLFIGKNLFSIRGSISKEDAIKVANSLK